MPDNTTLPGGDTYASDEITQVGSVALGVKVQRVKAGFGVDGEYADVEAANPLPVAAASLPLPTGAATQVTLDLVLAAVAEVTTPSDTQPVSVEGIVTVDGSGVTQPVSGTFWQATQPVSAAALPLPSGAATSAKQDTGNTSLGSIDGKLPALMGGRVDVNIGASGATVPVSAAALPLPTGAATEATLAAASAKLPAALVGGRLDVVVGAELPAGTNVIGQVGIKGGGGFVPDELFVENGCAYVIPADGDGTALYQQQEGQSFTGVTGTGLMARARATPPAEVAAGQAVWLNATTKGELFVKQTDAVTVTAQPGVDIGDVTINNAAGAAAVNIQDGGNVITVDGTVTANLAAGTNNIGDVDVLSLPALPAGNNNIGNVDVVTLPSIGQLPAALVGGRLDVVVGAALPAGTANIGDVDVLTLPSLAQLPAALVGGRLDVVVGAALPAGTANIGDVDVLTLPALPAGTNNIGDVDVLTLPALTVQSAASDNVIGNVSLGNTQGKTQTHKTGTLASSSASADQVILTYTVTSGKTFYITHLTISARLTTFAATATNFGNASLEINGVKQHTWDVFHAGAICPSVQLMFPEPIAVAAGIVVRVVCTPSSTTAYTWRANFGGYERS